jgi:mannose-6-phosphate isomerase-like protein (cupin superfamily)
VTARPPRPPGPRGPDLARLFPGGTAVSLLAVYDWSGPDGVAGGSAHVHLACTEGYVVVGGRGRLQTLSGDGYAETPLTPLTVAWFSPGVIHRLINDGGLQILVVMQNGGLPEAGDSVLTFPPAQLADPRAYRAAASLPDSATATPAAGPGDPATAAGPGDPATAAGPSDPATAARARKDLAVAGFVQLRERVAAEGQRALDDFYAAAAALVRGQLPAWREAWEAGPFAAAVRTGNQIGLLASGIHEHLREGRLTVLGPRADRGYGMCGRLAAYPAFPPDAT